MQTDFTYENGVFKNGFDLPEAMENEDYEAWIKRIGCSELVSYGDPDGRNVVIYQSDDSWHDGWYLAEIGFFSQYYLVKIIGFPSLMTFIRDFVKDVQAEQIALYAKEILLVVRKFFAESFHDPDRICKKCDVNHGWE